jgi:HK97 family phage portal protein
MYYNPLNNDMFYLNPTFNNKWDNGDNYLHFYINSNDGYQGVGIPTYAYKTISLALSTEKSTSDFWASGGQLNALISTNGSNPQVGTREKQIQSLRQSWDEARSRSQGTGIVFVPADLKYTPLSASAKDSALIESRLFNVQEIARWFSLSPVLLGDYTHTHYNSLSDADTEFVKHCLQPYIVMIEEEMQRKLIMPSKQDYEFIDLDENAIISIDKGKQADYLTKYVERGILTPNEVRKLLGYPAKEGADELSVAYSDANQNKITGQENTSEEENEEQ